MGKHSNHPTIWLTEARKKGRGEKWYVWSYAAAPSRREIVYNVQTMRAHFGALYFRAAKYVREGRNG